MRHVSDRIAVMYLGKMMELSPAEELYDKPIHPYTSALLVGDPDSRSRARTANATRTTVEGEPPNPINPPPRLPLPHPLPRRDRASAARPSRR